MGNFKNLRYSIMVAIFLILMVVLIFRLFYLTVVEHDKWNDTAKSLYTKKIYIPAPRGRILDKYGRVLATSKKAFSIGIKRVYIDNKKYNSEIKQLLKLFKKTGDQFTDNFPILINSEDGNIYFSFDEEKREWLEARKMNLDSSPKEAFYNLRVGLDIPVEYSDEKALKEIQNRYNIYPPINIKTFEYSQDEKKKSFLKKYGLSKNLSAREAFNKLRENFEIKGDLSDEDARSYLVIRDIGRDASYQEYKPSILVSKASEEAIMFLEEKSQDFQTIEIVSEIIRDYPNGKLGSHALGYLALATDDDLKKGYNRGDSLGRDGIEGVYEDALKGKSAYKQVEVNSAGKIVRTIKSTSLKNGKDIYLTLDLDLQKVAEKALKDGIVAAQGPHPKAESGALVAIEIPSNKVLAIASYPDYDPNEFVKGISYSRWNELQRKNPHDPLSPAPLFNNATQRAAPPGSIFKMVTATAALNNGLDPNQELYSKGFVKMGNKTFGCSLWNSKGVNHGNVNLYSALASSCNYYFFNIGSGNDFATGKKLKYHDKMTVTTILNMAKAYGLNEKSGIELNEASTMLPSSELKKSQIKNVVENEIIANGDLIFKDSISKDRNKILKNAKKIASWVDENPSFDEVLKRLEKIGIKEDKVFSLGERLKFSYFKQGSWNIGDQLQISIGQGQNNFTPVQIAKYVATLANKGNKKDLRLIEKIQGEKRIVEDKPTKIKLKKKSIYKDINRAMVAVTETQSGTLQEVFKDKRPYKVAAKTGTAEMNGKIQPQDEVAYIRKYLKYIAPNQNMKDVEKEMKRIMKKYPNIYTSQKSAVHRAVINLSNGNITNEDINIYKEDYDNYSWVVAYAPADNPKIAVVSMIVQGGSSKLAGPAAREVISSYLTYNSSKRGDFFLNDGLN